MQGVVLPRAHAIRIVDKINQLLGYPKAGTNFGRGLHIDTSLFGTTTTYTYALTHPTNGTVVVVYDAVVAQLVAALKVALPTITIPDPIDLDDTWFPAPVIVVDVVTGSL